MLVASNPPPQGEQSTAAVLCNRAFASVRFGGKRQAAADALWTRYFALAPVGMSRSRAFRAPADEIAEMQRRFAPNALRSLRDFCAKC